MSQLHTFITLRILTLCTFFIIGSAVAESTLESQSGFGLTVAESSAINLGQKLTFDSSILQEQIALNIYLPASFQQSKHYQTFPVLFVNGSHGDQFFHQITGMVKHLTSVDRMPDTLVVSLNNSGHFPQVQTNGMWRASTLNAYGDINRYIKHLQQELFPYLRKHYNANDYRQIIGISGSSLFPLYALANKPKLFEDYMFLAASDMIGMGFSKTSTIYSDILQAFKHKNDKQPNSEKRAGLVYFVDADDDIEDDPEYQHNLAELKKGYVAQKQPAKHLVVETISNERHYDALLKGMLSFIDKVYPESLWAPKYRELIKAPGDALQNIEDYYQVLSKQYGYQIYPNADRWNSVNCLRYITRMLYENKEFQQALTVAKRWQYYLPDDVSAMLYSAKIQLAQGKKSGAKTMLEKALQLAKADNEIKDIKALLASVAG
ncbi:hypothetical protein tinsulaeT_29740 [Thalassotalea insulae]|uniref:Esterase n=1 Tax=Thalassotalea insulae TaxID=2056778 RepID=A0ABQ6GVC6_9GAMM|nr:alpha/beta hydrolase-fold protein [Thalassotalea insulae]GLX79634.1 hypothetical protein tinsulaeT_29740 [Thalassotalea insulae]